MPNQSMSLILNNKTNLLNPKWQEQEHEQETRKNQHVSFTWVFMLFLCNDASEKQVLFAHAFTMFLHIYSLALTEVFALC